MSGSNTAENKVSLLGLVAPLPSPSVSGHKDRGRRTSVALVLCVAASGLRLIIAARFIDGKKLYTGVNYDRETPRCLK